VKPKRIIEEFLAKTKIDHDQQALNRLDGYLVLLQAWSKKMNLISRPDRNEVFSNHFIPSFWYYLNLNKENPGSVLDIGSGAGFPGLILKILKPELNVYLVESNYKKSLFLKECTDSLELNTVIINDRIEKYKTFANKTFDVIVSRAVTSIKRLIKWSENLLDKNGSIYVIKGKDYKKDMNSDEIENIDIVEIEPDYILNYYSPKINSKLLLKIKLL
jgi:16S rRNA (guanine527-N7)-methyltransferase